MATFIEAADLLMRVTHPGFVFDFSEDEELFFEEFDHAYEKVLTQQDSWEKSDQLSQTPFANSGIRNLVNSAYAFQ